MADNLFVADAFDPAALAAVFLMRAACMATGETHAHVLLEDPLTLKLGELVRTVQGRFGPQAPTFVLHVIAWEHNASAEHRQRFRASLEGPAMTLRSLFTSPEETQRWEAAIPVTERTSVLIGRPCAEVFPHIAGRSAIYEELLQRIDLELSGRAGDSMSRRMLVEAARSRDVMEVDRCLVQLLQLERVVGEKIVFDSMS